MTKTVISTDLAPPAVGPYSQAIKAGSFVYCSGQIALKPDGSFIDGSVTEQTEQIMQNLKAVLAATGLELSDIIKTTIYLTDIADFKAVNEVYGSFFTENPPARATIGVAALPLNAKVEIEAIAVEG